MAEHQHFNADANNPVLLLSSMPSVGVALGLGGIVQLEDASEYLIQGERTDNKTSDLE